MAVTKIHGIKTTVDKAIEYICNPDKTDQKIYISSFACSPETAALDFKYTLDHAHDYNEQNKAFHLIQAFQPGEVSYDEAHLIGTELANRLLNGKYSYVLTTHIDKEHIHNHLIFCAVDNFNFSHYHDCKKSYWNIRHLNDTLCKEHGLSIIHPEGQKGMKYNEWRASQTQSSFKAQLRKDINQTIKSVSSYTDFLLFMRAKGYEIKNSDFGESSKKYITFRSTNMSRPIRGSSRSLGSNFTKERIKERIENKTQHTSPSSSKSQILDTSDTRFSENPGLKKWAIKENLKTVSEIYKNMLEKNIHNLSELQERISFLQVEQQTINSTIVDIEHQLKKLSEILKYAEQYQENKPYYEHYQVSKDPERYFRKYESRIILFSGAEHILHENGIDIHALKTSQLKKKYATLLKQKTELLAQYNHSQNEQKHLIYLQNNMNRYLSRETSINSEIAHSLKPEKGR